MREMRVAKNDAGQRLDRFLTKAVPALPGTLAQKYIRLKRIKVNGGRTDQAYRLLEGDTIQLFISDVFFEAGGEQTRAGRIVRPYEGPPLSIVYEDEQILIVDKPPGVLCHADNKAGEITLVDQVKAYLHHTGVWDPEVEQSFVPALCNRLDRNTGGLVLAAKTAAALQTLNEKIRSREIDKYYLLAVHGRPDPPEGRIEGLLTKDGRQNRVTVARTGAPGAKSAVTVYRTLESKGGLSLVECRLETGRTHQIRAQMAALGCPLLGDRKYGGRAEGEAYQALWAYRVCFQRAGDRRRSSLQAGVLDYLDGREFLSGDIPKWNTLF